MTLSQPFSEYSSIGSPQEAPALLTKISSFSPSGRLFTRDSMPFKLDKSAGKEIHSPPYCSCNLFAVSSHTSAFLELI